MNIETPANAQTTPIPLGSPGLFLILTEGIDASGAPYAEMRIHEWDETLAYVKASNRHSAILYLLTTLSRVKAKLVEEAREILQAMAFAAVECIVQEFSIDSAREEEVEK